MPTVAAERASQPANITQTEMTMKPADVENWGCSIALAIIFLSVGVAVAVRAYRYIAGE